MNERQRILELVKKGILSTEEGLDLLESMAKAKDEAQIKQAADKVDSYHRDQATNLVDEWETGQDTEEAKGSEKQDLEDIVYLAVNPYWESILIHLPKLPEPLQWHLAVDTSLSDTGGCTFEKEQMSHVGNDYLIGARTVVVLTAH